MPLTVRPYVSSKSGHGVFNVRSGLCAWHGVETKTREAAGSVYKWRVGKCRWECVQVESGQVQMGVCTSGEWGSADGSVCKWRVGKCRWECVQVESGEVQLGVSTSGEWGSADGSVCKWRVGKRRAVPHLVTNTTGSPRRGDTRQRVRQTATKSCAALGIGNMSGDCLNGAVDLRKSRFG